ncbi:MAG: 3-oxoacyl-[Clostridia bacterium]|nr:3-oxoacyl-[acyl-carrier-protein] reductase [Clostridia bacterium]
MFKGRTALITGAARGIGKAIAVKLASEGANIVIFDVFDADTAVDTLNELAAYGVKANYYRCDITDSAAVDANVKAAIEAFGKIDILVNNAGITKDKLMIQMSEAEFDAVINVNLKGTFLMTKTLTRHMMRNRYGRIVNMASIVGITGNEGQANYSASKAGVIALTKTTAKEFASRGITCNAVAPGFIDTGMTAVLSDAAKEAFLSQIPVKRVGTPEDVANAVAFLASEASSYITGEVIKVTGGMGA